MREILLAGERLRECKKVRDHMPGVGRDLSPKIPHLGTTLIYLIKPFALKAVCTLYLHAVQAVMYIFIFTTPLSFSPVNPLK